MSDDEEDAAPPESQAIDPLAAEPLTTEEIARFDYREPHFDEDRERTLQVLQASTEATMPIDGDAAETLEEATDQILRVRVRPRSKVHP